MNSEDIAHLRTTIPPIPIREVDKPPNSDDEDAKKDFNLKRKIHLENGRRVARQNQMKGRRLLEKISGMQPAENISVKRLLEIAGENVHQVRSSNVSLTPLRNSTATNAEEAFRSNERRSRLSLHKKARSACSQSTESESFRVTAGAIRTSATLNDLSIPDVPDFFEEDIDSLSQLYFN